MPLDETQDVAFHPQGMLVVLLLRVCVVVPVRVGTVGVPLPGFVRRALLGDALQGGVGGGEGAWQRGSGGLIHHTLLVQ